MDDGSEGHNSIWARLGRFFGREDDESLEQAIIDAREDGEVEPEEESMLLGILRFNDLKVFDTMTPRTDIDCVSQDLSLRDVAAKVVASGHSRIPVYKDTRDNIVGIVHAKDLLSCLIDPDHQASPVSSIMREPFFVPETKTIRTLLQEFRSRKQHIAIALDEYGGTSGLVTMEDLLEEIVGNIYDEFDPQEEKDIEKVGDNLWRVAGSCELERVAEATGVQFPEDEESDTLGGLVFAQLSFIPEDGSQFTVDACGLHIEVQSFNERRVEWALVSRLPEEETPEEQEK